MSASGHFFSTTFALLVATMPSGLAQNITRATTQSGGQVIETDINHKGQNTERDSDGDGISDVREMQLGTNPHSGDTDGDGLADGVEAAYGSNPLVQNAALDVVYRVAKLPMPAGYIGAEITDISNGDFATGYAYADTGPDTAVRWNLRAGNAEIPPVVSDTYAEAVNNSGVVVGQYNSGGGFRWSPGQAVQLIGQSSQTFNAWDVNSQGDVVGEANRLVPGDTGAYLLKAGSPTLSHLATLPEYAVARAMGINDKGQVGGMGHSPSANKVSSVIWNNGIPTLLEILGSNNRGSNFVYGISENGTVFGIKDRKARIWPQAGGTHVLPTTPAGVNSYPWKMNGVGEIIGEMNGNSVIWRPDGQGGWTIVDINSSILDADPDIGIGFYAYSINDQGQIAGGYYSYVDFEYHPVILTPMLRPSLAVDANRDGTIKLAGEDDSDATTADKPYRFWPNDDDDSGDDKRSSADDIPLLEGDSNRDSANDTVDGIRDLEDFFPVFLDLKQMLTVLPPGTDGVSYYLRQEDEAVGVVFTNYTRAQAFDYLRGPPANLSTGFGPTLTQKAGEATATKVTTAGVDISTMSPAFFSRIQNNNGGVILVEASKVTTKPLVLEVRKGSAVIAEVKLELKTDPAETMFHYHNIRSLAHGTAIETEKQGPNYNVSTPSDAPNDPFQGETNRKNVIFVHGYNVNGKAARGSAGTVFKRFYWSGSKARFYAVLWRGDDGQGEGIAPAGATPDYHRNVGHAWQQGPLFRDFLETLQGETAIMAHSLGNVVTQVALTRARDPDNAARLRPASRPSVVKNYFAIDAALPLEAVDGSAVTPASKDLMRASSWKGYDERLWSTHWHELFPPSDARSTFTWWNVFSGLDVGTNFYSSGEEVLANPEDDVTPFWEPLFFHGLRAWVAQEKIKGGNSVSAVFFRSATAGWTFNTQWYKEIFPPDPAFPPRLRTPIEARDTAYPAGVPTSSLPEEPFFKRFQASETHGFYPGYQGSRLMAPLGDANADDEARKLVTFAKCLGEGIPALSFAQGRNESSRFTGQGMGGNFDLNIDYNPSDHTGFKNGWPASRSSSNFPQRWLHSDCLDVAYTFNFPLYDKFANDGGFK